MADSLMFNNDAYVVLETGKEEELLTPDEMVDKLRSVLSSKQNDLPLDVQKYPNIDDQIQYLLDTSCEFDLAPGEYLQWYAVRLEK
jgi:Protein CHLORORESPIRATORY REDUCTION 7